MTLFVKYSSPSTRLYLFSLQNNPVSGCCHYYQFPDGETNARKVNSQAVSGRAEMQTQVVNLGIKKQQR